MNPNYLLNFLRFGRKMIFCLLLTFVLIVVLEIWIVNRLSTYGEKINKLENIKISLIAENQYIKNQISQKSSLLELQTLSEKLGFRKIQKIEYINEHEN